VFSFRLHLSCIAYNLFFNLHQGAEIRRIRLETAQILLMHTPTLGMDVIASRCGYGSLSAFSTFFRQETGQSPSAWRFSAARSVRTHGKP